METFDNTVVIRRTVEEVFAFLADFQNLPAWNYAIEGTKKMSPGPVGVGTVYRQSRSVPNRGEEIFEVVDFQPVRRVAIQGQFGPLRLRSEYVLTSVPTGTSVTNRVDLVPPSGILNLVAPIAIPRVRAGVAENLTQLKRILEEDVTRSSVSP